jgi:hypothetical protein
MKPHISFQHNMLQSMLYLIRILYRFCLQKTTLRQTIEA